MSTRPATTSWSTQTISFGQSPFDQQLSTSSTPSSFGSAQSVVNTRDFGTSKFTFKPSNEAVFKPIFSGSPEPASDQFANTSQTISSSSDSSSKISKSVPLGFSFSQPAVATNISAPGVTLYQKDSDTNSSSSTNSLQFTFSQPAAPYNTTASSSANQLITIPCGSPLLSAHSNVIEPLPAPSNLCGGNFLEQISVNTLKPKIDPNAEVEIGSDDKVGNQEMETSVFARLGKGIKRKEESVDLRTGPENAKKEDVHTGIDAPRHPPKRPPQWSSVSGGGLFGKAVSGLMRPSTNLVRRELMKEREKLQEWGGKEVETHTERRHQAASMTRAQESISGTPEEAEEFVEASDPDPQTKTPVGQSQCRGSPENLGGFSPTDSTVIQCKNVPSAINRKDIMEKHFCRFGKVQKVLCRPARNLVIVHFQDHAAAAKAKKRGKLLNNHEILIFWQRKKRAPEEKKETLPEAKEEEKKLKNQNTNASQTTSPLRSAPTRTSTVSSHVMQSHRSPEKKPPIAKSLQFDIKPQQEQISENQSSDNPVPNSVLYLVGKVADTAEEKYRLLEQVDKNLRQGRPKRTDLDLSKVFVGTCPDMCPEKERYMRETRNLLSAFEVIPNTEMVDHCAAIKEYSRSSADQEEPLPHELRPLSVLSMTMDYLVTQIIDQGHDNYRDWYDFVWNRTRGIRKDITQQHLCDPLTVSLLEKCTRFHVHCAHHLCEEPMMSFDSKINNENLTKCMQSLKEMYQDLATRAIYCPQEAEFRQYNVLLKLNDGDILREVQQFRDEVRNSPEVKFAVQAFAALNSNNFVRFFKLVKSASYLAGCLLHRYFTQVRDKGLKTLNIAHTVGSQRSTTFYMQDMVRMLMFHSTAEATDFVQQYGLNINDGFVELSRTAFQEPDPPLPQRKSMAIMMKRTVLIGEVVNGGPLPQPPKHISVGSFDSQNKYCGEASVADSTQNVFRTKFAGGAAFVPKLELKENTKVKAKMQIKAAKLLTEPRLFGDSQPIPEPALPVLFVGSEKTCELSCPINLADPKQEFQNIFQPQPITSRSPSPQPHPVYADVDIMAELECVIEEALEAGLSEVAKAGADYAETALVESKCQLDAIVSEVLEQMLTEISATERTEQAEEKLRIEQNRRKQKHEAFLSELSVSLCSEIRQEVLGECIQETAASEIRLAIKDKAACVARCSYGMCTSLVEETLAEEIALLVGGVLEGELQCIHKYIKRWRDVAAVRRQLKRQMRGFPAAPCCVNSSLKLMTLAPSAPAQPSLSDLAQGMVNLGNAGTMAFSSSRLLKMRQEVVDDMRVQYYYQKLLKELVWSPLNLPSLVAENLLNPPDKIFWKASVLLPCDHESVTSLADRDLSNWLEFKLGGLERSDVAEPQTAGTLRTLCVSNTLWDAGQHTLKVHISIKVSRGPLTEKVLSSGEECELQGTGALLMLLPAMSTPQPGQEDQDVPLLSALLQLKQLQQAGAWHCPVPLVILVSGPDGCDSFNDKLVKDLKLNEFVEEGLISEHIFIHIPEILSDMQGSQQLAQAIRWLVARAPSPSQLCCQTLVQFVEAGLSREFSSRLRRHHNEQTSPQTHYQEPTPLIRLYNAVLAHLADAASSENLSSLSWPPEEFALPKTRELVPYLGWNSAQHLGWIRSSILSLQLPHWDMPATTACWSQLCSAIFQYASQIAVFPRSQPLLMSRLENLLHQLRPPAVALDDQEVDEDLKCPYFHHVPWHDIVILCIDHKLKDWGSPNPPAFKDAVTEDGEILIYFPREALQGFQPPEEWLKAVCWTQREKQQESQGARKGSCILPTPSLLESPLEHPDLSTVPLYITHSHLPHNRQTPTVIREIEEEKVKSQRCMDQLHHWLDADPIDSVSLPLLLPTTLLSMPSTLLSMSTIELLFQGLAQQKELNRVQAVLLDYVSQSCFSLQPHNCTLGTSCRAVLAKADITHSLQSRDSDTKEARHLVGLKPNGRRPKLRRTKRKRNRSVRLQKLCQRMTRTGTLQAKSVPPSGAHSSL
ncbi:LOW QUALITY PROTEIN: germinal-center associated nuclear protein [Aplochiton taeniatus]